MSSAGRREDRRTDDAYFTPNDLETDSAAYAWFLWKRGYNGPTGLSVISWRTSK